MVHRLPRRSGPWKVTTPSALPSQQGLSLSVLWAWDAHRPDLTVNLLPHLATFTQIPPLPVRLTQIVQLTKQPLAATSYIGTCGQASPAQRELHEGRGLHLLLPDAAPKA